MFNIIITILFIMIQLENIHPLIFYLFSLNRNGNLLLNIDINSLLNILPKYSNDYILYNYNTTNYTI